MRVIYIVGKNITHYRKQLTIFFWYWEMDSFVVIYVNKCVKDSCLFCIQESIIAQL